MTPEAFCDLAIQAITDKDARVVLEDNARELDWFDERLTRFPFGYWTHDMWFEPAYKGWSSDIRARAIAAVLLFGGWPEEPWELAMECQKPAFVIEGFTALEQRPGIYLNINFTPANCARCWATPRGGNCEVCGHPGPR